jgi:crossover junction endodeoxyribonuclease RuvC
MGIAVVEGSREKPILLYSTCIETNTKDPFIKRLHTVITRLDSLLKQYRPDAVAVEEVFFSKNQKTAMLIAHVRGAILYLLEERGVYAVEYNPSTIKIAVTGEGRAEKRQIINMLQKLVRIGQKKLLDDEYDAIAIALTHLVSTPYPQRGYNSIAKKKGT